MWILTVVNVITGAKRKQVAEKLLFSEGLAAKNMLMKTADSFLKLYIYFVNRLTGNKSSLQLAGNFKVGNFKVYFDLFTNVESVKIWSDHIAVERYNQINIPAANR